MSRVLQIDAVGTPSNNNYLCAYSTIGALIRASRTGPAVARPIIFPTTYIDSEKRLTETVAVGPIISAKCDIYVNKGMSTIYMYIYKVAMTRNSKRLL